ncbi:MAG: ABC transporter substrate-binding protein [Spirochaetaceae bacterium]|jgi:iron complex transport system substrate-binding protein|nr:ABC transporter substrate-binding protein [Spirochaetaceae bacterium]
MERYFRKTKRFMCLSVVSVMCAVGFAANMSISLASCTKKGEGAAAGGGGEAVVYNPPLTFDNYGRAVTVNQRPQSVLTLGPNCTEVFAALGLADYIVGNSLKNHSRGPLPEYAEIYQKIPELNYGSATRERVVSSGADFIYGLDWEFGGDGLDIAELEKYGMTVYVDSAQTFDQAFMEILDMGKIFGVESAAQNYIEDQKTRLETVRSKIAGKPAVNVLIYDSGNNGVFTCSGINFETLIINAAGGKNIFDNLTEKAWITVSYEEVLARNPDVIIIHDYDSPSVEEKLVEIRGNSTLSQLDAVKNNRFVTIELESVLPGNRIAYAVEKLAKGLYPSLF